MVRSAARGPFALALFFVASAGVGVAQQREGSDRVFYTPKKGGPVVELDANLKMDASGVKLVTNAGAVKATVTAAEIVRTYPVDLPAVPPDQLLPLAALEAAKEWDKARAAYEGLKEKYKAAAPDRLRRWLAYRVAYTTARAADDTPADGGWQGKAEAGAKLLTEYVTDYPAGWEAWQATRTAARLSHELGKAEAAAKLWAKLVKAPDLTPDLKAEAAYQEADALFRAGRVSDAGAKAAAAAPTAPAGPARDRLNLITLAAKSADAPLDGVRAVDEEITKTRDPAVRATGFALTAELYLKAGKAREAMWALLWVEVVYNQDKEEVAKALARLVEVFKLLGDEERERNYQDRMRRNRSLL